MAKLEELGWKQFLIDWVLICLFAMLPMYITHGWDYPYVRLGLAMVVTIGITYFELSQKLVDWYENM